MKKQTMWVALAGLLLAGGAQATLYSYDYTTGFDGGTTVADGNLTGWSDSHAINNIAGSDTIAGVTVRLSLSGGYNGDLYGYLVLTDTATHAALGSTILLNRVGTGGSASEPVFSFGYSDTAMNVTLADGGANGNIHDYQDLGAGYNTPLTTGGTFANDGGTFAGAFGGQAGNNTWTLFLVDESTGGTMTVNSWGMDIEVVPEPVTWASLIFGAVVAGVQISRRMRQRQAE